MNFRTLLFAVLCAALGVVATALGPKAVDGLTGVFAGAPKYAVLNLNRVVRANEIELAARNLPADALQAEAETFARRLKDNIEALQKECGCTFFVSSAVIAPHNLPDYTEELLKRLSLSSTKESAGLEKLSQSLRGGAAS